MQAKLRDKTVSTALVEGKSRIRNLLELGGDRIYVYVYVYAYAYA